MNPNRHRSGEPCPKCETGEKDVDWSPNTYRDDPVECTNDDCDWEAVNGATG